MPGPPQAAAVAATTNDQPTMGAISGLPTDLLGKMTLNPASAQKNATNTVPAPIQPAPQAAFQAVSVPITTAPATETKKVSSMQLGKKPAAAAATSAMPTGGISFARK